MTLRFNFEPQRSRRLKMTTTIRLAVIIHLLVSAPFALANEAPRAHLQVHVGDSRAPGRGKTLYIRATGKGYEEGAHPVRYAVFDGNGKEIMTHTSEISTNSAGAWRHNLFRDLRSTDAPGTWWITLEVAGKPAASANVEVTNAR